MASMDTKTTEIAGVTQASSNTNTTITADDVSGYYRIKTLHKDDKGVVHVVVGDAIAYC